MMKKRQYQITLNSENGIVPFVIALDKQVRHSFWLVPFSGPRQGDDTYRIGAPKEEIHIDSRREFIKYGPQINAPTSLNFRAAYRKFYLLGAAYSVWFEADQDSKWGLSAMQKMVAKKDPAPQTEWNWGLSVQLGKTSGDPGFIDAAFALIERSLAPHMPKSKQPQQEGQKNTPG